MEGEIVNDLDLIRELVAEPCLLASELRAEPRRDSVPPDYRPRRPVSRPRVPQPRPVVIPSVRAYPGEGTA